MGEKLAPAVRDVLQREAYLLELKHITQTKIVELLHSQFGVKVSRQSVNLMIQQQRRAMRDRMDESTVQQHLDEYVAKNDAVEQDAWKRLAETNANAQNGPGLQSNILSAAKNTATALGVLADGPTVRVETVIRQYVGIDPDAIHNPNHAQD